MDAQMLANLLARVTNPETTKLTKSDELTADHDNFINLINHFMQDSSNGTNPNIDINRNILATSAQSLLDKSALPGSLTTLNEISENPDINSLLEKGIYTYAQEQWFESITEQATRETLKKFNLTETEYNALPANSPLRKTVDEAMETAVYEILANRLQQAQENAIMEIIDIRTRLRAQVLGRQGISPDEFAALPPVRQSELEAQVRKEMLKLQGLLRDGYSLTEAFQKLATA